jgi:hypothetical protein
MASNQSTSIHKLTEAGLARTLGVSRQAIHDLVKRGILSKDKDDLIDVEMAKIALANRVRPSSKTAAALQGPATSGAPAPAADGEMTSFHVAKTLREASEAGISRIKLAEMQGKVVQRAEVDAAVFEISRALRDGLTNTARRIAAEVASLSNTDDCEAVIEREHRALLASMAEQFSRRLK